MSDHPTNGCVDEFEKAMPAKPWTHDTPLSKFDPLINLIENHTQSDLFRHVGDKYKQNGDYYDIAKELEDNKQSSGKRTFPNGVTAEIEQSGGWPTKIDIEDKATDLKETLTLRDGLHTLTSDKVEFCGVARTRLYGDYGEYDRTYSFPGGSVEKSGDKPPVLKIE